MANFEWALAWLKAGKKVRQPDWPVGQYIHKYCADIYYCAGHGEGRAWQSYSHRLLAEDWELYDDRPPLDGTFGSTMTAVSQGHKVERPISGPRLRLVEGAVKHSESGSRFTPTIYDIKATDWKYYD